MLNFIKIRLVGANLFHADGQTDMTNLTVAFRNFANAPKQGANVFIVSQQNAKFHKRLLFFREKKKKDLAISSYVHVLLCGNNSDEKVSSCPLYSKLTAFISKDYKEHKYAKQ
jgi:hypothetical protein